MLMLAIEQRNGEFRRTVFRGVHWITTQRFTEGEELDSDSVAALTQNGDRSIPAQSSRSEKAECLADMA